MKSDTTGWCAFTDDDRFIGPMEGMAISESSRGPRAINFGGHIVRDGYPRYPKIEPLDRSIFDDSLFKAAMMALIELMRVPDGYL